MKSRSFLWLVGLALPGGCGGESRESGADPSSGVSLTGGTMSTDVDPTTPPDDDDERLDTPMGGSSGNIGEVGGNDGCEKVDFLFVIDSSFSMQDEQDNLLTSFPGFIAAIEDTLMFNDFHLMVVDAGLPSGGAGCDGTLGAGQRSSGAGMDCGLVGPERFATQAQPDLAGALTCMGSRGIEGPGDEQTMDSLVAALGPLSAPGGCNEGFLRDDAVLVVTIITDEEDSPGDANVAPALDGSCEPVDADANSAGSPASWGDAVIAAKNGDTSAVVVLGLMGDCDVAGTCPGIAFDLLVPNSPITGAEPAPRLREFVNSFQFGSIGPVCAPDYAPFFEQAVSVISNACDDFVPPQ